MSRPHLILKSTHTETCSRARSKGWTITDFEHLYLLLLASTHNLSYTILHIHTTTPLRIHFWPGQYVSTRLSWSNVFPNKTTLSRHVHLPVDFKSPPRVAKLVGTLISTIKKSSI